VDRVGDPVGAVLAGLRPGGVDPAELAEVYRDLHRHPEPAFREVRTAGVAAGRLRAAGFEVTAGVGGTGVVGVLRNGDGPTVLLRADLDALPLTEDTGLPYASTDTAVDQDGETVPVMHGCGHDMHTTMLAGAAALLAAGRAHWRGTVLAVFQPAEETGAGARAVLDDGLFERFGTPDAVFGQHLFGYPAGELKHRDGPLLAAADTLEITLFGRGGHGSTPERTVDPVVMAAAVVLRLQAVVSREVAPADRAVLTVARLRAGHVANVIPAEASLTVNLRAYDPAVRDRVRSAVHRIVDAEAAASGAPRPPEYRRLGSFPATANDPAATAALVRVFQRRFGADRVTPIEPMMGSEDFGWYGTDAGVPSVFWGLGCVDPELYRAAAATGDPADTIPGTHSPRFAPVVEPTLSTGVQALTVAALSALGPA
jgi:hippurate hydrolase